MSTVLVNPQTTNIMNAVMCGLMSFDYLMTPQKCKEVHIQHSWFLMIFQERDNRPYLGQFMKHCWVVV